MKKMPILFILLLSTFIASCKGNGALKNEMDVKMNQPKIATQEQIKSMDVVYAKADIEKIKAIVTSASVVLTGKLSVSSPSVIAELGEGKYSVPKQPNGEVTYILYDNQVLLSFGLEGGPYGGIYKGYLYSFTRKTTNSPWQTFSLTIAQPYGYTVNVPVTKDFFDELGLVLFKAQEDHECDSAKGKCNAFWYKSKLYPNLGYKFLTDPGRSDLKSGVATNFREVSIEVIKQ